MKEEKTLEEWVEINAYHHQHGGKFHPFFPLTFPASCYNLVVVMV